MDSNSKDILEVISDFVESANSDNQTHINGYLQIKKSLEEFRKNKRK